MDKQGRWRAKQIAEGKCPRCGDDAYPYHLCYRHRMYSNIQRAARRLLKAGVFSIDGYGRYSIADETIRLRTQKVKEDDPRKLPRFNGRPMNDEFLKREIIAMLKRYNKCMSEQQILDEFFKMKTGGNN